MSYTKKALSVVALMLSIVGVPAQAQSLSSTAEVDVGALAISNNNYNSRRQAPGMGVASGASNNCLTKGVSVGVPGAGLGVNVGHNACERGWLALAAVNSGAIHPDLAEAVIEESLRDMGSTKRLVRTAPASKPQPVAVAPATAQKVTLRHDGRRYDLTGPSLAAYNNCNKGVQLSRGGPLVKAPSCKS